MENQKEKLMQKIDALELGTVRGMKDSLSDFFIEWVNSLHDRGTYNEKQVHESYTWHFGAMKNLLTDVEKFKVQKEKKAPIIKNSIDIEYHELAKEELTQKLNLQVLIGDILRVIKHKMKIGIELTPQEHYVLDNGKI